MANGDDAYMPTGAGQPNPQQPNPQVTPVTPPTPVPNDAHGGVRQAPVDEEFDPSSTGTGPAFGGDYPPYQTLPERVIADQYQTERFQESVTITAGKRASMPGRGRGSQFESPLARVGERTQNEWQRAWYTDFDNSKRATYQQKLWLAGFLSEQPTGKGNPYPSNKDWAAWTNLVDLAGKTGYGINELLDKLVGERGQDTLDDAAGGGGQRQGLAQTVKVSNPADLRKIADDVAQQTFERKATDEEKQLIVAAVQAAQRAPQEAVNAAQRAARDGADQTVNITEPASPDVAAENILRQRNPVEAGGMDLFGAYSDLANTLFGGR